MAKKTGFIALATVSLGVNIAASGVVTNVWNNATGDGKWSSVGNWSEGHSPTTAEYAFVSNEVDGAVIDIDVDDLTIKALVIGAPSEAVTNQLWFFGKGITLTEQFTGTSGSSVGRTEIPDKLVPLQVRSRSMVVFDVPVTFSNLTQNTGLWHGSTTGQTLTFLKTVNVPGSTIFYLHGNDAAYVDFKGLFNHPEGLLCGYMYPCSRARFYGPVHVKEICKGVDYNNPSWSFHNPDTQYKLVQISHGTWLHQDAPGVFSTNHVLDVTGHPSINANVGSGCYFNLGDQPRTEIDRLSTAANAATWNILTNSSNAAYCGDGITSMVGRDTRLNGYGHARLTLRGTADDVSGLALYGAYGETYATGVHTPIDLEWDPIGDFTQTLFGRVHCCFGTLTVKRGTLKVAGAASFAYVPRISVLDGGFGATFDLDVTKANALQLVRWIDLQGANARFRIGANAATPFAVDRAIAIIDSGAKFVMPAGAAASFMAVVYNGERIANDTYTGGETTASAKHADWIDGEGTITVTAAEKLAYWTGAASGAYEAGTNWAGGAAPGVGTTAVLLDKAIGKRLHCIFVDNGLLRYREAEQVEEMFKDKLGLDLTVARAAERFYDALAGLDEPEAKRKAIGKTFIDVFAEEARRFRHCRFLGQGTIYPDVIESSSATKKGPSQTIKSHHNVGGLPPDLKFELVEPLRDLFKDEVRAVGRVLGMADELLDRQPFPGPGLGVRILGEVTREKVELLQQADLRVQEEVRKLPNYKSIWQTFAVLLPVKTVGVMGDCRTYEYTCAIRSVDSIDAMTADWTRLPYETLATVSNRIINEVRGINRVVYDISSKPPATIEWE